MTSWMSPTHRAERLLKLYPKTWRARYGVEFVDLMEQAIADEPHKAKRTANIVFKSFKVRLSELGLIGPTVQGANASRNALSTSTLLATVFGVFALFYWSSTMVSWNSNPHTATTFAVSLWTGAITVCTMILILTLFVIGVVVIFRAVQQLFSNRDKRIVWPLVTFLASAVLIVNGIYQFTRFTIARGGIQWSLTGSAVKQVAGATQWATQSIIWGPSWTGGSTFSAGLLHISTTVAVIVLAFTVAKLIRLSEFSLTASRVGIRATKLLSLSMLLFLVSCGGWELAGGHRNSWMAPFTQMQKSLFFALALIVVLGIMTSLRVRNRPNSIEIVSSNPLR
jgi:hypothetical protein